MNEKAENLLNELVSKIGTAEEFEQVQKQLFRHQFFFIPKSFKRIYHN